MPISSELVPVAISAYGLQSVLAAIFVPQANEKFYDMGGCLGFISSAFVSLYYPHLKARCWDHIPVTIPPITSFAPRQILLNAALVAWSTRLGSFLFSRALKAGGDSRFDEVKHQPARFTFFWMAQATWVMVVGLPVYLVSIPARIYGVLMMPGVVTCEIKVPRKLASDLASIDIPVDVFVKVNTLSPAHHPRLGPLDYLSAALWAGSWLFEIVADHQKTAWRRAKDNKEHDEKFISKGLWGISRHPNYVGEVGLWTGLWLLSGGSLRSPFFPRGAWLIAGASPLLTWFLLTRVSGIPLLESAGDKKYGTDPKWQEYKRCVLPIFPYDVVADVQPLEKQPHGVMRHTSLVRFRRYKAAPSSDAAYTQ